MVAGGAMATTGGVKSDGTTTKSCAVHWFASVAVTVKLPAARPVGSSFVRLAAHAPFVGERARAARRREVDAAALRVGAICSNDGRRGERNCLRLNELERFFLRAAFRIGGRRGEISSREARQIGRRLTRI